MDLLVTLSIIGSLIFFKAQAQLYKNCLAILKDETDWFLQVNKNGTKPKVI